MAAALRQGAAFGGPPLQHAASLGHIDVSTQANIHLQQSACYESEDEAMGRRRIGARGNTPYGGSMSSSNSIRGVPVSTAPRGGATFGGGAITVPLAPAYSRGDIREQYCLSDRQLTGLERDKSKKDRLFGCLSGRAAPPSFLGVCVGRRAPSDENLNADYAPIQRYPRYPPPAPPPAELRQYDEDLESSYFRRRPTSFCSGPDPKRYSWVAADEEDPVRMEGPRPICADYDNMTRSSLRDGRHYLSQSSEQLTGGFRCPAHPGLPPPPPPPGQSDMTVAPARPKHVSFARSHTLTSFDEAMGHLGSSFSMTGNTGSCLSGIGGPITPLGGGTIPRTGSSGSSLLSSTSHRLGAARSQERLIGGKRPAPMQEVVLIDKPKRGNMKTQATQTEVCLGRRPLPPHHLSLSPRTVHRVKMVSQGAQTNGGLPVNGNGRRLMKSFSEAGGGRFNALGGPVQGAAAPTAPCQTEQQVIDHEPLHRTQSEEPPKSPFAVTPPSKSPIPKSQTPPPIVHSQPPKTYQPPPQEHHVQPHQQSQPHPVQSHSHQQHQQVPLSQAHVHVHQQPQLQPHNQMHMHQQQQQQPQNQTHHNVHQHPQGHIHPHQQLQQQQLEHAPVHPQTSYRQPYFHQQPQVHQHQHQQPQVHQYQQHQQVHVHQQPQQIQQHHPPQALVQQQQIAAQQQAIAHSHAVMQQQLVSQQQALVHSQALSQQQVVVHSQLLSQQQQAATVNLQQVTHTHSQQQIHPQGQQYHQTVVQTHQIQQQQYPQIHQQQVQQPEIYQEQPKPQQPPVVSTSQTPQSQSVSHTPVSQSPRRSSHASSHGEIVQTIVSQPKSQQDLSLSCDSETDSTKTDQKEIFIDFEPRLSPKSPEKEKKQRKKLQKTLSEGEILLERRKKTMDTASDVILATSTSEEELKTTPDPVRNEYTYFRHTPIKDEGIFKESTPFISAIPSHMESETSLRTQDSVEEDFHENLLYYREMFRKRSVSLEDPASESVTDIQSVKSAPPSPLQGGDSVVPTSPFPSSDSLANDLTRDHSDGIWNESQATVLQAEQSPSDVAPALLTPSAKRKHLLLQHQQRSSIDTEALDDETQFEQVQPLSPRKPTSPISIQPTTHKSLPTLPAVSPPSIAVTSSPNLTDDDRSVPVPKSNDRKTRALSPSRRKDLRKRSPKGSKSAEKSPAHRKKSPLESTPAISVPDLLLARTDSGKTTDISESTTTDDYVTATDTSRRHPAQAQNSQTGNQDGSSFESASSLYSLARVDAIYDDAIVPEEVTSTPTPHCDAPSPAHSASSSSSGSYSLTSSKGSKGSAGRSGAKDAAAAKVAKPLRERRELKKGDSVSDDERSAHYSSSGYCDSPELKTRHHRRSNKEWTEEERKRKKSNFNLELSSGGSQEKQITSPVEKRITPEETKSPVEIGNNIAAIPLTAAATITLPSLSPRSEREQRAGKRVRSKGRRTPRIRSTSGEDSLPRRRSSQQCQPVVKSPPHDNANVPNAVPPCPSTRLSPLRYANRSPGGSPAKQRSPKSPETTRLKALSAESLRSVSPGSDSVFYSETAEVIDHQVHCHHCGKEVEIVTAAATSEGSVGGEERPDIVQPPAGFADSPDGIRTPHPSGRLYKKLEKRFRSEERPHGERRHHRIRQDVRAKSEERGKDEHELKKLRAAGSSPSVLPDTCTTQGPEDNDQGVYPGCYRRGVWICIGDVDAWRRPEGSGEEPKHPEVEERRGSTESEKEFRKKFQAITHRLVHRRSCVEMYKRQGTGSFAGTGLVAHAPDSPDSLRHSLEELLRLMLVVWCRQGQAIKTVSGGKLAESDKTVIVRRDGGEFGFRIHGSKPVVVSAIEPDTPAETSGLEVGDIVLSVNGVSVLDKSHSEVVKIAHAGSDTLELEVARTVDVLNPSPTEAGGGPALYSGYLWRQGGYASGTPSPTKWVRRWFCLKPDHCLYYYKTDTDTHPVGAVLLSNHQVSHGLSESGRPHAFRVTGGDVPPLQLAADSEEAAARWVAVMAHAAEQGDPWLEVTTRVLRVPAAAVPRPDCFGYLMKLGSKWRAWSKRYCVLKDACLYFYNDGNSKNAFGMACLQGYRVQPSSAGGKKHAFEVAPPEPKQRHYYFHTESEMDKKRWVAALEYSIDRWMKAG